MMDLIWTALPYLLRGTLVSISIAGGASIIGMSVGTLIALSQQSSSSLVNAIIEVYLTLMRGTPMLIQIPFFCYYIFPLLPFALPISVGVTLGIGLNSAAYMSQIIRSGINAVQKGQLEAAHTLGLSYYQTLYYIVLPQTVRTILPSLINELITLIKDSSLASTVGIVELFKEGTIIISSTYNAIPIYCAIASIYITLTLVVSRIGAYIERKINIHAHH